MPTSLFIEHHAHGLAFYINGDLQFDTVDEAIYHEHLVVPAIALAQQRFADTPLRVLICGGGDGLAVRDVLRFPQVQEVTLVDYNPEVLELGRTVFRPYNRGSLLEEVQLPLGKSRVAVHTQDAFDFVAALPDACYHVVICDFTFPTSTEETRIYSREWFQQVQRLLSPGGVMSTNGVSPEHRTLGFWCLYQTLLAAGLQPKPMQVAIPSFRRHGYGDWGFFLGSAVPITRSDLETISLPPNLQALAADWLRAFVIPAAIAQLRHQVTLHTLECPQLLYYLLNPQAPAHSTELAADPEPGIDFLTLQETVTAIEGTIDHLELEAMVQRWLAQLHSAQLDHAAPPKEPPEEPLIPVQHRYHSPQMTQAWLGYVKSLVAELDAKKLLSSLLDRAQELPPQVAQELKQLAEKVRAGQPLTYVSEHTTELITILCVTLIMANLNSPDVVFAKGYSGSSGGYSSYDSDSGGDGNFGFLGFMMMMIGGMWLSALYNDKSDD